MKTTKNRALIKFVLLLFLGLGIVPLHATTTLNASQTALRFEPLATMTHLTDDVVDANLITKLDGLDAGYLAKLESTRWNKWAQGNYFKTVTKAGKDFKELICKQAFKNRSSAKYLELKQKFQTDFVKNLDDYEMFSQVQLKYNNNGDYFVADQIFVKYDAFGDVEDLIVLENKLSSTTSFSPNQTSALQSNLFTVRSVSIESGTSSGLLLNKDEILNFSSSKQWYKVYSSGDGSAITGIQKIN